MQLLTVSSAVTATATPVFAIIHLGGKEAVRGMVDAMREVCQQWK